MLVKLVNRNQIWNIPSSLYEWDCLSEDDRCRWPAPCRSWRWEALEQAPMDIHLYLGSPGKNRGKRHKVELFWTSVWGSPIPTEKNSGIIRGPDHKIFNTSAAANMIQVGLQLVSYKVVDMEVYRHDQVSQIATTHILHCYEKLFPIHVSLPVMH